MLTKYGLSNIIIMISVGMILFIISAFFVKGLPAYLLLFLGFILISFTFIFFRDPERNIPKEALEKGNIILSPADGKIIEIVEEYEPKYFKEKAVRISIFLSPLDVHVNRIPISGIVDYFYYQPGSYLVAYHPKSSELNEQTHIGLNTIYGKVLFKQIVGIVARRLVCEIKEGDTITVGNRFGMMKFGSRMDIIVPIGTEFKMKVGERVVAGETIIANLIRK
jgi:phosphatidylserine decarboxylase